MHRKLRNWVKNPYRFHVFIKHFYTIRQVVAIRKDINNAAAHRKLPRFIYKIGTNKAVFYECLHQKIHIQHLIALNINAALLQNGRHDHFFKQGFGIGYDDLLFRVAGREIANDFGAPQHVIAVEVGKNHWFFETIGQKMHVFFYQTRQIVVHIGGFFLAICYHEHRARLRQIRCRNHKILLRTHTAFQNQARRLGFIGFVAIRKSERAFVDSHNVRVFLVDVKECF